MSEPDHRVELFEQHRRRLRAVAFRMLGSLHEAEDVVQDAWLRFSSVDPREIENLGGWFTTVVARLSLDRIRTRSAHPETRYGLMVPEPVARTRDELDPEDEALLADSVGLALLVVLDVLSPAERLAFVLHDLFKVPFTEIADILGRSPDATKMLASRARGRVRRADPSGHDPLDTQRAVVKAFIRAARGGSMADLIVLLDPSVTVTVRRPDGVLERFSGATTVADRALMFRDLAPHGRLALVNGHAGVLTLRDGEPVSALRFEVAGGKVTGLEIVLDPRLIADLHVVLLDDGGTTGP